MAAQGSRARCGMIRHRAPTFFPLSTHATETSSVCISWLKKV